MQPPVALTRRSQVAWIGVLLLLLYLLLSGAGASNGTYLTPFRIASLVLLVGVFLAWSVVAWQHASARPRSAMAIPIATALAALVVATIASERPRLGWEFVVYGAILAGLYLLLVRLMAHPGLARRVVVVTAACTLVVGVAYVAAVVLLWIEWWGLVGRLAVPPTRPGYQALMYGAPGILTAFLATAAGSSLALLWPMGRAERALGVVVAVIAATGVFLAAARSGWAGVGLAVVVTAGVALVTGHRIHVPSTRRARAVMAGSLVVAAAVLIAVAPAVLRRLSTGGGEELRATLAATAIRLFGEHPLSGAGPGTWVTYRAAHTLPGETDYYIPHAHNMPLQLVAETGVIGAIAAIVVIGFGLRLLIPSLRSRDPVERAAGLGLVYVVSYLFVHQLFDFFMDMPAVLYAAALPLAVLDARHLDRRVIEHEPVGPPRRGLSTAVPLSLALGAATLLLFVESAALSGDSAADLVPEDPGNGAIAAEAALQRDPRLIPYAWTLGFAAALQGDAAQAEAQLRAVAEHDDFAHAWLDLAALSLARDDRAEASVNLDRALRLGVQQPAIAVAAVPLLLELGEPDRAADVAAQAFLVAPSLVDDPWWDTNAQLATVRDGGVESAIGSDPARAWLVAMFAGDPQRARALAATSPDVDRGAAALVIDAWVGEPAGRDRLEAAAAAVPLGGLAGWAARVAARDGDTAAADRFHRWAAIGYGTSGADFGYDTVIGPETAGIQVPGPNAGLHFRYTYRRDSPVALLIPGLVTLTMR